MLNIALSFALVAPIPTDERIILETILRHVSPELVDLALESMRQPPPGCGEEVEAAMADFDAAIADGGDTARYFEEITLPWLHEASTLRCDGEWPTDMSGEPVEPAEYRCTLTYDSDTQCYDGACTCASAKDCAKMSWFCDLPSTKEDGFTCSRRSC